MISCALQIIDIRIQTPEACTICFKQPALRKIKYKAGQYILLNVKINGRRFSRAYSLSSSPSLNNHLEITVKRVPNGIVSNYIIDELRVGDIVEVSEPMGHFVIKADMNPSKFYFWGAGSGITPLFSIINELLISNNISLIQLIYSNQLVESSIFLNQLLQLKDQNKATFKLTSFYSKAKIVSDSTFEYLGRINTSNISHLISIDSNLKDSIHFICGPLQFKLMIQEVLIERGIVNDSIFAEDFKLELDEKEFKQLEDCSVKLMFQSKEFEIYVPKGKSVLDIALDNNIEIPYSCQTGDCGTCKAKLHKGQLLSLGSDKSVNSINNEYLLCCSYPLTKEMTIVV